MWVTHGREQIGLRTHKFLVNWNAQLLSYFLLIFVSLSTKKCSLIVHSHSRIMFFHYCVLQSSHSYLGLVSVWCRHVVYWLFARSNYVCISFSDHLEVKPEFWILFFLWIHCFSTFLTLLCDIYIYSLDMSLNIKFLLFDCWCVIIWWYHSSW